MLRPFNGPAESSIYPQMIEYNKQSTKIIDVSLEFPTTYEINSNWDVLLFKFLYIPLIKVFLYEFKITTTT